MEAKELKKSNLVFYNGNHKEVGEVTSIITYIVGDDKVRINHRADVEYKVKDLKPIPITIEWLRKFGFYDDFDFKHFHAPIYFIAHHKNEGEFICFLHNCSHGNIKFVHQLQNLFYSITQTELTVD